MRTHLADATEDVSVDGHSARVTNRRMGRQSDVPLVLPHRFRGTIDWWAPEFLDYLAADHDVILFDNAVDLLGWSLGGFVAQQVALQRPELVRKLVVAEGGPGTVTRDARRRGTTGVRGRGDAPARGDRQAGVDSVRTGALEPRNHLTAGPLRQRPAGRCGLRPGVLRGHAFHFQDAKAFTTAVTHFLVD